jgi:hypothetical protein
MRNKYLVIKESSTETNSLGNPYPDIMTFPINKFRYNDIPIRTKLTSADIARFDLFCFRIYNNSDYTDLLLWLNDKASVHQLVAGEEVVLPSANDINNFYLGYR